MAEESAVAEFIREQVPDWDDEVKATARFKAFSGQRSDWEARFSFWRDLIIKIARCFDLVFLSPSQMKNGWFNRGGLTPLCLDDVLLEMYKAGDLLRSTELGDPTAGRLSYLFKKMMYFSGAFRSSTSDSILNDRLILSMMLEDKADGVVKTLSQSHWTSACIVTMRNFESLFKEHNEAVAVLSYLSGCGRAKYLSVKKKQLMEGVKVSLSSTAVPSVSSVDSSVLQLIWTVEELQRQIDIIDQQYERFKSLASAALKSGNRKGALRNARQFKIVSENREKIASFLNRVEAVLHTIMDVESTKKVSEAIQSGAQAIKENRIDVQEVQSCLQAVDEFMYSQEEIHKALEPVYDAAEEEDLEEELRILEWQIVDENLINSSPEPKVAVSGSAAKDSATAASLSDVMLGLKLEDVSGSSRNQKPEAVPEAA